MKRTLPEWATIDGTPYSLDYFCGADRDGEFSASDQHIWVKAGAPIAYERYLVMHELIHACYEHSGANEAERPLPEEEVCVMVARRLLPILRDNPELVSYLTSK